MNNFFTNFSREFGVIPVKSINPLAIMVLVHGADGSIASFYALARRLNISVVALSYEPSLTGDCKTIEQFAAVYLEHILNHYAAVPYILAGHSFGGLVAYEMANQLHTKSKEQVPVFLLDPNLPLAMRNYQVERVLELRILASTIFSQQMIAKHNIYHCDEDVLLDLLMGCFKKERLEWILSARKHCLAALSNYIYREHSGVMPMMIHASEKLEYDYADQNMKYITNGASVRGNHFTMLHAEYVEDIAAIINAKLEQYIPSW